MARYAEIENSFIVNVFTANENFIKNYKPNAIKCPDTVGVGDKFENDQFIRIQINNAEII